jgi:hypothetical protein
MPERWRSPAARALVKRVRAAGGTAERAGPGRLRVTGPAGTITIQEPAGDTRRDLRRDAADGKIITAAGLVL